MWQAHWQGTLLAESNACIELEGNTYFPPGSYRAEYLIDSATITTCPWKGEAHYYHVTVNGMTLDDAAWYYPAPKDAAGGIKDHVAFWKGVEVRKV